MRQRLYLQPQLVLEDQLIAIFLQGDVGNFSATDIQSHLSQTVGSKVDRNRSDRIDTDRNKKKRQIQVKCDDRKQNHRLV